MLIFEHNIPDSYRYNFTEKVKTVSSQLGINPNWLMAIINWESARSFSPSIRNKYTGATGLIQFMPATAQELGTTVGNLAGMDPLEQLDWVYKYYVRYRSKLNSYTDLYLTTFYPVAVGKPSNYVLGTSDYRIRKIAEQNPGFDLNKDQRITKGEIEQTMLRQIPGQWLAEFKKKTVL